MGRKSYDIETAHPDYGGGQTKGGRTTAAVVQAFIDYPARMHELALAVRATVDDPTPLPSQPIDIDEDETFDEGRSFERRHRVRERDPRARRKKIARVLQWSAQLTVSRAWQPSRWARPSAARPDRAGVGPGALAVMTPTLTTTLTSTRARSTERG